MKNNPNYEFSVRKSANLNWYKNQIKKNYNDYKNDLKNGKKDPGYVWPMMNLVIFLEGVFTLKAVPNKLSIDIPAGVLNITAAGEGWVIRNDYNGSIGFIKVEGMFDWAITHYPDGIDEEGYEYLAMRILSQNCTEEQMNEIYDKTFYEEAA